MHRRITATSRFAAAGCLPLLVIALAIGCAREVVPGIAVGIDACAACNMVIDQPNQACGYVTVDRFIPFDSPGCLLRDLARLRKEGTPLPTGIYFADHRDGSFHPAATTTFLLTDHVRTVMNGRVLCFGNRGGAETARSHEDESVTDWTGYRTARGIPDRTVEVLFTTEGMVPSTISVEKEDLVLIMGRAVDMTSDLRITVRGYEEVESVILPASGEIVEFRLLALRPGAGFPVVDQAGTALGMLKVSGAHTAEEGVR